jgi:hypothetical protein
MIFSSVIRRAWKPVTTAAALASVASLVLLHGVETVDARQMTRCQLKHSYCAERCIMNNDGNSNISACFQRTCDHQYSACARASGESADVNHGNEGGRPRPSRGGGRSGFASGPASGTTSPLGGGILENGGGGLPQQGPASTGSPVSAPSAPAAPPVILR